MAAKRQKNTFGWSGESLLKQTLAATPAKRERRAEVFVHLNAASVVPSEWISFFPQSEALSKQAVRSSDSAEGIKMLVAPLAAPDLETEPKLKASRATRIRDAVAASLIQLERLDVQQIHYGFELPSEDLPAAVLGLEMALYRYKRIWKGEPIPFKIELTQKGRPLGARVLDEATALGQGVNLARHLVNIPPNLLNPPSYADFVVELFRGKSGVKVEVWDEVRLKSERMGLHLAVGQGSDTPPRLVHIQIKGKQSNKKPVAFVGKGITFDTGGLDLKPASGMRLMKKDMGGSAAVVGLAYYVAQTGAAFTHDFYIALAENAVGGNSFRPSDVIEARNGTLVEIHNTDAEGRLVLADAMDVAVTAKEKPRTVIDVATLTGAIKVALGASVAGLFSSDPKLSAQLEVAAQEAGDPVWTMPLVQRYRSSFNTPFADLVNATDGFGGAITAALFLERFARDVPWAHLDIYAWRDGAEGPWAESGGSGQAVPLLAEWLKRLK